MNEIAQKTQGSRVTTQCIQKVGQTKPRDTILCHTTDMLYRQHRIVFSRSSTSRATQGQNGCTEIYIRCCNSCKLVRQYMLEGSLRTVALFHPYISKLIPSHNSTAPFQPSEISTPRLRLLLCLGKSNSIITKIIDRVPSSEESVTQDE